MGKSCYLEGTQGRVLVWLGDDGTSRGQSWPGLTCEVAQRIIKGSDGGHDTHGLANDEDLLPAVIQERHLAAQPKPFLGEVVHQGSGAQHFVPCRRHRLSDLHGQETGQGLDG